MNCRSCGAAIPQRMAYCPTCKQPVFQEPGSSQRPPFPPPSTGLTAGSYGASPQKPTSYEGQGSPGPFVSSLPSPQTPDNTYASQLSMTRGPQPHTENLSPMPFGQPGNQFSPATNDQPWPAPFTQGPGQQFFNSFPPAQPHNVRSGIPQTQPFAGPTTPGQSSNVQQSTANMNASQPFFTNQGSFPAPSLHGQPPSGRFPRPAVPPANPPERSSGPWSAPANFSGNVAQPGNPETSSRFLYGPSTSSSFPFNAGGPSTGNLGANISTPSTLGQGFPFANPGNTPEPVHTNPSGHLASAIIAPTRQRRNPASMIGIIGLIVVLAIGGIIGVVQFTNGGSDGASNNSISIPVTIPLAGATPVTGPSGQKATTTASSIIINAQTASTINVSYIPTQATTSFATNQTIYASLVINSKNQSGYIMIKWYANNRLLNTDNLAHNAKDDIAFFTQKYTSPSSGSAELYWCTKADCSDAQLARVVNFTVH
jgi:hypothetical protein